ncbi:DUF2393 family protein [Granulicella mallensis]|uniref:DUF2393 domain-containing protein n=1 Tax=Granulicella mallensis (strain ATCC BAA-1857 / DSM 23137 / MP5ACTX8) TaxID=682795 RepID=G8NVX1_GRAMM|nr:DUF2393 family protein [Granulicella mallensis]AEU38874.1 hypothetical protein AciX8_4604 [Granulicella mallensis MP5ACTX8]
MQAPDPKSTTPSSGMFNEPPRERSFPTTAVGIASVAVVILVLVLVMLGHRHGSSSAANAAYGPNLAISNIQMSESTSISGGKSTYIDGHIANHGPSTVTGVTVQVLFANDTGMPPQTETVPLSLIRTREPYIDTEPVSAAPLAPGAEADFRLIFEGINDNWNQQKPEIHATQVSTR